MAKGGLPAVCNNTCRAAHHSDDRRGGMRNVQDHQAQRVTAEKHISESERRERAIEMIDCDLGRSVVMQTDRVYITAFSRSLP